MLLFFFMLGSFLAIGLIAVFFYRSVNRRSHFFQLNKSVSEKLDMVKGRVQVGDEGVSITRLNPMGKAVFGEQEFEVTSPNSLVEKGTSLIVTEVSYNKIIVKAK